MSCYTIKTLGVILKKIVTMAQLGHIITKGLSRSGFAYLCKKLAGWYKYGWI